MVSQGEPKISTKGAKCKNYVTTRLRTDPWIIWKVWDRYICNQLQDIKNGKCIMQRSYLAEKLQKLLSSCENKLEAKDARLLQTVQTITLEEREPDSPSDQNYIKIIVHMKQLNGTYNTLETVKTDDGEKWELSAIGDMAEVLRDTLKPDDVVVIWGGLIKPGSTTISLNIGENTSNVVKSYVAIHSHDVSPDEQFNTTGVINNSGLENTIIQKICPIDYPVALEGFHDLDTSPENEMDLDGISVAIQKKSKPISEKLQAVVGPGRSNQAEIEELSSDSDAATFSTALLHTIAGQNGNAGDNSRSFNTKNLACSDRPVLPLTRNNIRRHTSNDGIATPKERVTKFVTEKLNVDVATIGPTQSACQNQQQQIPQNGIRSPASVDKVPASASESEVSFSQSISICLDTQEYVQMDNDVEFLGSNESNLLITSPEKKQCVIRDEPGLSQYSIDRLLDDLERKDCVEESDEEQFDSISERSDKTLERVPTIVSQMQLCDLNLKRVRQFHLRCTILKTHVDDKENIIMIRVSDGTIPPFCAKELLPRYLSQSQKPDQSEMILATLEVDILIRNSSEFVQKFNDLCQEVILYNVTIEKDKNNLIMLTMDGSFSRIERALPDDDLLKLNKGDSSKLNSCYDLKNNDQQSKGGGYLVRRANRRRLRRIPSSIDDDSSDSSVPLAKVPKLKQQKVRLNNMKSQSSNIIVTASTNNNSQPELLLQKSCVVIKRMDMTGIKVGTPVKLSTLLSIPKLRSPEKPGPSKLNHLSSPSPPKQMSPLTSRKEQNRLGVSCRKIRAGTPSRCGITAGTETSASTCQSSRITRNENNTPSSSPARRHNVSPTRDSLRTTPKFRNRFQPTLSSCSDSE